MMHLSFNQKKKIELTTVLISNLSISSRLRMMTYSKLKKLMWMHSDVHELNSQASLLISSLITRSPGLILNLKILLILLWKLLIDITMCPIITLVMDLDSCR